MKELARRWLTFADKDRQTCEQIKDSHGLRAIAAFHAQQTIEKSLKAILVCQGQNPPRVHDLVRLAALVTAATGEIVANADELERTNQPNFRREIRLHGKRRLTTDMALRSSRFFVTSE